MSTARGVAIKAGIGQHFGMDQGLLAGMLGRLDPSLKAAKIRLGSWNGQMRWPRRAANRRDARSAS